MGFISALLLTYKEEECAFWILNSMINKYDMEGFYLNGFPGLEKAFYIMMCILKKHLKKTYDLLVKYQMVPSMFASQWFITVFSVNLRYEILVRIFDVFLDKYCTSTNYALAIMTCSFTTPGWTSHNGGSMLQN